MIKNRILIVLIILMSLYSCDDIFEEDISGQKVTQIFPKENNVIQTSVVPFQWTDVKDASSFRLQIALESGLFVLDTLVNAISFDQNLENSEYKWRVRAENFAYQTTFTDFISFSVTPPTDLSEEQILLSYKKGYSGYAISNNTNGVSR